MKNRVYILKLDSNLDKRMKALTERLGKHERIVAQSIDQENKQIIITTEEHECKCGKHKNLLLEEAQKRAGEGD